MRLLVGRDGELETLGELLAAVAAGGSAALIVRGEPGVGKSALLEHVIAAAEGFQVVRAEGVEGEVDLPYAGLQQLCRSMTDAISVLPQPQSEALRVAFGLASGGVPDRYLVGLAALGLMSEVAGTQPVLCVVDDAQWLDPETTRALAFVARRLGADSVALVFASREIVEELDGVPELLLGGLGAADSRALLDSVVIGHLDDSVRERILAETHGNPLALTELPRALTSAEAATGIVRQSHDSLTARIERASGASWSRFSPRRASCCCSRRPSRSAIHSYSSVLQRSSALASSSRIPPRRPASSSSASAAPSATRSFARPSTARRRRASDGLRIVRSRRQPTLSSTPIGGPGTARRPRWRRTRTSQRSSCEPPRAQRHVGVLQRQGRSWSVLRC